jgi:transposase-like protein
MKYLNIKEALEQLKKCEFNDTIGHPLENNTAFIYLDSLTIDKGCVGCKHFIPLYKGSTHRSAEHSPGCKSCRRIFFDRYEPTQQHNKRG